MILRANKGMTRVAWIAVTLVSGFAFALLLMGQAGEAELIAAGALAVAATAWVVLLGRVCASVSFGCTHTALPALGRAIGRLPRDTAKISVVLVRAAFVGGSPGIATRPAFRFGTDDDPLQRTRRATAVVAGSLTPDAIVVDVRRGRSTAHLHQMVSGQPAPDAEWLA